MKNLKERLNNVVEENDKLVKAREDEEYQHFLKYCEIVMEDVSNKVVIASAKVLSQTGEEATTAVLFSRIGTLEYPVGPVSHTLFRRKYYQQFIGRDISYIDTNNPKIVRISCDLMYGYFEKHLLASLKYISKYLGVPAYGCPLQSLITTPSPIFGPLINVSSLNPSEKEVDRDGCPYRDVIVLDLTKGTGTGEEKLA